MKSNRKIADSSGQAPYSSPPHSNAYPPAAERTHVSTSRPEPYRSMASAKHQPPPSEYQRNNASYRGKASSMSGMRWLAVVMILALVATSLLVLKATGAFATGEKKTTPLTSANLTSSPSTADSSGSLAANTIVGTTAGSAGQTDKATSVLTAPNANTTPLQTSPTSVATDLTTVDPTTASAAQTTPSSSTKTTTTTTTKPTAAGTVRITKSTVASGSDREAPEIIGVKNITIIVGGNIAYKAGVSVRDNSGNTPSLSIDNSKVVRFNPGNYPVVYSAKDAAGNTTTVSATVIVLSDEGMAPPIDEMNRRADDVLAKIIKPGMTKAQKARAIFDWVSANITYDLRFNMTDWVNAANYSLTGHYGDCFNYYATSRALLTRAGIENLYVERIDGKTNHYWNLVNVGTGWYHFDTCIHLGERSFVTFMRTDAEVEGFSQRNLKNGNYEHLYYKWDKSKVPASPTTPFK